MRDHPATDPLATRPTEQNVGASATAPDLSEVDWQRYGAVSIVALQSLAWVCTQSSAGWAVQLLWLVSLVIELVLLNALMSSIVQRGQAQLQTARHWQALADIDSLTGLFNRRYLDREIEQACLRARREGSCLSVLMVDIDHFKQFNDTYGHTQGDDCLRRVASVLRRSAQRQGDVACRYGGEEFAIILPRCDVGAARVLASQLCLDVRAMRIPHNVGGVGKVSVSVGISGMRPGDPYRGADLLRLADAALYAAKRAGRDRVCDATEHSSHDIYPGNISRDTANHL